MTSHIALVLFVTKKRETQKNVNRFSHGNLFMLQHTVVSLVVEIPLLNPFLHSHYAN